MARYRPTVHRSQPQAAPRFRQLEQLKAELRMNEFVHQAVAYEKAGKLKQARAALAKADLWKKKAGIQ